jgi:DNA-binding HxlR family transcriptional regulator
MSATARSGSRDIRSAGARPNTRADVELIGHMAGVLDVLRGKWKVHLLFLMARGVHRHGRLLDCLPGASKRMMTDTLRALERDGVVRLTVFREVPARVEHALSPLDWSLTEPLIVVSEWGESHLGEVAGARAGSFVGAGRTGAA